MRRVAIINQKGGVGKTTTAVNVGMALARAGHRVLLIDLDPQAHLTLHLGQDPASGRAGLYEMLTGSATVAKARRKVASNLWIVGSSIDLAAAEVELVSVVGREVILRDLLDQHVGAGGKANGRRPQYDYVLMDCPPSLGVLTLNGLCAADEVFIPLQPHYLALQGLGKLLETVSLVGKRINPGLRVTGILVCMNEAGTKLAAEVVDDVRTFFAAARGTDLPWATARVFDTVIRRNIKLAESPSYGKSIFDYAPDSNGAKDYERIALEVHDPEALVEREAAAVVPAETEAAAKLDETATAVKPDANAEGMSPEPSPAEPVTVEASAAEAAGVDPALTEPVRPEPVKSVPRKERPHTRTVSPRKARTPSRNGKAARSGKESSAEPSVIPAPGSVDSPHGEKTPST